MRAFIEREGRRIAKASGGRLRLTTAGLRRAIGKHYGLGRWVTLAEVEAEFTSLRHRGLDGICGDARREALRDLFIRWGRDPVEKGDR